MARSGWSLHVSVMIALGAVSAGACGVDVVSGNEPNTPDGGQPVGGGGDGGDGGDGGGADSSVISSGCDRDAAGCITVPSGWSIVATQATSSATCPAGFEQNAPTDVVEGPTAAANACACAACIVTPGSCATGAVKVAYDNGGGGCGLAGVPSQNSNNPAGQCGTDMYKGSTTENVKFTPPPAVGTGSCTSAGEPHKENVTYAAKLRVCQPNNAAAAGSCSGDKCAPAIPTPWQVCLQADGDQSCPATFTTKHLVGTDVALACNACSCSTSTTCTGTLTYYTDGACQNGAKAFVADGVCRPSGTSTSFSSYRYIGTPVTTSVCILGAPSLSGVATLMGEKTVCCIP